MAFSANCSMFNMKCTHAVSSAFQSASVPGIWRVKIQTSAKSPSFLARYLFFLNSPIRHCLVSRQYLSGKGLKILLVCTRDMSVLVRNFVFIFIFSHFFGLIWTRLFWWKLFFSEKGFLVKMCFLVKSFFYGENFFFCENVFLGENIFFFGKNKFVCESVFFLVKTSFLWKLVFGEYIFLWKRVFWWNHVFFGEIMFLVKTCFLVKT